MNTGATAELKPGQLKGYRCLGLRGSKLKYSEKKGEDIKDDPFFFFLVFWFFLLSFPASFNSPPLATNQTLSSLPQIHPIALRSGFASPSSPLISVKESSLGPEQTPEKGRLA